jgi:K(+)-stimulated pyrophosphate-energized sodium pump
MRPGYTSAVSFNPVIKFTTLFGLLAVEIAVKVTDTDLEYFIGSAILIVGLVLVCRSFHSMRSPENPADDARFKSAQAVWA